MRARGLLLLAGTLTALALVPGAASAAPDLRDLGPVADVTLTDGSRFVATWPINRPGPTPVRVYDLARGTQRVVTARDGCQPLQVRHASLLLSCADLETYGPRRGLLLDLRTGVLTALPMPSTPAQADSPYVDDIGSRWMQVRPTALRGSVVTYMSRDTGQTVTAPSPDRHHVTDLDASWPIRQLCAGKRRPIVPGYDEAYGFPGPQLGALAEVGGAAAATTYDATASPRSGRVERQRCHRPVEVLARCGRGACGPAVITTSFVAWTRRLRGVTTVRVYRIRTGRTHTALTTRAPVTLLTGGTRLLIVRSGRLARPRAG